MTGQPPARNRVAPTGRVIAVPGRGAWMGNRGRLHEGSGSRDVVRDHRTKAWITCRLEFRGRRVAQWHPHHYTPLFFLDEAVALAAGHRPCAECRRADFNAFRTAWARGGPLPSAPELDQRLHAERRSGREPGRLPWPDLPDGVFVRTGSGPAVVVGDHLAVWDEQGNHYAERLSRPDGGRAAVLTPLATVSVLGNGYPVQIDREAW